jgi:hypothetical protein
MAASFRRYLTVPATRMAHAVSRGILAFCITLSRPLGARRLAKGKPRTMWGITPIVTLPLKARSDRMLGFRSESVVFTIYYITRAFTWNLSLLRRVFGLWPTANLAGYRVLLGIALLRYDVFHIFADRGIMPPVWRSFGIDPEELEAIHAAGKRLYVYGYGADVRTRTATEALGRWNFCAGCDDPGRYCVCDDAKGQELMSTVSAYATALVSLGDMLTYMPNARHLAYWPIDTDAVASADTTIGTARDTSAPLRIAHAPNHPHFKGTKYLDEAIARLASQGHAIELIRVTGVTNTEVIRLFATADIIADQFIGGAYGYTALEGLARGKPVFTYVRSPDLVLAADECPFFNVQPEQIEAVLLWCLENRTRLATIGRQGRAYIERHHSVPAVAARFAVMYRETAQFPQPIVANLSAFERREAARQASIEVCLGWHHPWQVTAAL